MDLERFQALQTAFEESQRKLERAQGAIDQILDRLKEEFECTTIEQAHELLEKLSQDEQKAQEAYQKRLTAFEAKYGERLA